MHREGLGSAGFSVYTEMAAELPPHISEDFPEHGTLQDASLRLPRRITLASMVVAFPYLATYQGRPPFMSVPRSDQRKKILGCNFAV